MKFGTRNDTKTANCTEKHTKGYDIIYRAKRIKCNGEDTGLDEMVPDWRVRETHREPVAKPAMTHS